MMFKTIKIDDADKDLLLEICELIVLYGSKDDPILKESASRIVEYIGNDKLEIQTRYVDYIRRAFPAFYKAYPDKRDAAEKLRHKLSSVINNK